ncbi:MAG: ATP-binding cassette domain-containing protein [Lachnospiraceae bacterium]|nr:ATP-binding cassette domain-containing protein [Lachnospiraceae bacterium]
MPIVIEKLSKKYNNGRVNALAEISTVIPEGTFGLLGENGAGKSSLLRILATISTLDKGKVTYDSYDIVNDTGMIRNMIGYLPQKFDFFEKLTVYEMLEYIALLKGIKNYKDEIMSLIEDFNLKEKENVKISKLSGGMKQRVAIAQALLGNPKYVILDEPTVGLDPTERLRFRNVLNKRKQNSNLIISTHIISDVAMMCENVGIMKAGKIIFCDSVENLLKKVENKVFIETVSNNSVIDEKKYNKIISILRKPEGLEIRYIAEEGENSVMPTLEDAYFYMINLNEG